MDLLSNLSKFPQTVMQPGDLTKEQLDELADLIQGSAWPKALFKFAQNNMNFESASSSQSVPSFENASRHL